MSKNIQTNCDGCGAVKQPDELISDDWVDCFQDLEDPGPATGQWDFSPSCWARMLRFAKKPAIAKS